MNDRLLEEFIDEECNESIYRMLISEIEQLEKENVVKLKEYTFNRFNLYLDFENGSVRIEDELNVEEAREFVLPMGKLLARLKVLK